MNDDDRVFKALADPTRRFLLDRLFTRDGRTLTELESELEMTRFGVMKHLRVLEDAGLVVTRRSGREKLHFLNPVPIRLIHDRWIDKYTERQVSALADLKHELEGRRHDDNDGNERRPPRSTACTSRRRPRRSGTRSRSPSGPRGTATAAAGSSSTCARAATTRAYTSEAMRSMGAPDVAVDGEVIEVDPPHKLVQTGACSWTTRWRAEGFTRLTYEIAEGKGGVTKLTVIHELEGAPKLALLLSGGLEDMGAGGGWSWVLSDLKSLLETGTSLGLARTSSTRADSTRLVHDGGPARRGPPSSPKGSDADTDVDGMRPGHLGRTCCSDSTGCRRTRSAVLTSRDPEIVRRYLELHRERLQEQLDDELRTLDVLEARPRCGSGDDPHLLERGGHMPRRRQTLGQGSHVTHAELQDGSALDLDPHGPFENHEDLSG